MFFYTPRRAQSSLQENQAQPGPFLHVHLCVFKLVLVCVQACFCWHTQFSDVSCVCPHVYSRVSTHLKEHVPGSVALHRYVCCDPWPQPAPQDTPCSSLPSRGAPELTAARPGPSSGLWEQGLWVEVGTKRTAQVQWGWPAFFCAQLSAPIPTYLPPSLS